MAKAAYWTDNDAEARKRGEQTGLDTLVVHAVNDDGLRFVKFCYTGRMANRSIPDTSDGTGIESHV